MKIKDAAFDRIKIYRALKSLILFDNCFGQWDNFSEKIISTTFFVIEGLDK